METFPFTSTANNYSGAVTDISNQGYGLRAAIATGAMDLIPNKLNLKLGGALASSDASPARWAEDARRGRFVGAELNAEFVDQDLMSGDRALLAELGIDAMRLGDLVAIRDVDHRFGRSYRRGWTAICLCIHGDSVMTGHGPGILTLITGPADALDFVLDPAANLAALLGIRSLS